MSWRDVEPLDNPRHEPLTSITRSVHLRDAMVSFGKQRLPSHRIQTRNAKVKARVNAKVLWFAPTKPMNQNNMYGNVSFTLDWSTALEQFGPHLYYIDQKETPDIIYTRVLLTNKCYSNLTLVNTNDSRMPLWKLGGEYHDATACNGVTHVLEIGIEADAKKEKRLYAYCKIQANDHSSANTKIYPGGPFSPCICHRYNYFKKVCPSPYSAYQTRAILNKKCPTMLRDAPSLGYDQSAVMQMSNFLAEVLQVKDEDDNDENAYEDGKFIANYDDHDNCDGHDFVPRQEYPFSASRGGSWHSDDAISTSSFGTYGLGSTYGSGADGRTGNTSSSAQASGYRQTATRHEQDEEWSTGSRVALVAGGLALFAGLAAAFAADDVKDDEKKKTKNWWE